MIALIWKEWRENFKWIPLPGLVILLVFYIDKPDEPMLRPTDAYFFCLTAVVFGAALGFVQVFFEAHGDKRSILMHRPMSPSRIFLAKAARRHRALRAGFGDSFRVAGKLVGDAREHAGGAVPVADEPSLAGGYSLGSGLLLRRDADGAAQRALVR